MPILQSPLVRRARDALERQQGNPLVTKQFLELLTPDVVEWKDDFLGDTLHGGYQTAVGTGATALAQTNPTSEARFGLATMVTPGTDNIPSVMSLGLHYRPDNYCVMLAGVSLSAITSVKLEVGFSDITATADDADGNSGAVALVLATPTATRTDGAAWVFDTDDTTNFQGFGVANTTVATKYEPTNFGNVDGDAAPNVDELDFLGVALAGGSARFFRGDLVDVDGNDFAKKFTITSVSEWQASFITATAPVTPYIFLQNRSATGRTLTIDYFAAWGYRYNNDI